MQTRTGKMSLADCCPVAGVHDGIIVSRDGTVTVGWELLLPEEQSVTADGYDSLLESFCTAFRALPDWTVMHRQDRYTWKTYEPEPGGSFLSGSFERHFAGRRFLEHRHLVFFSLNPCAPSRESFLKPQGAVCAFGIRRPGVPAAAYGEKAAELVSRTEEFMSVIRREGIESRRLTTADLEGTGSGGGLLQSWLQMGSDGPLVSDLWRDSRGTCVECGGKRLMAWSLSRADDLPQEADTSTAVDGLSSEHGTVSLSWFSPVGVGLECEHAVNSYCVRIPPREALSMIERKRRNMTAFSGRDTGNSVNARDLEEFMEMIHRESLSCVWTHADIMAWDVQDNEAAVRNAVSSALSGMGITAKMNTYDTPVLFWAALPGGEMELGEDNWRIGELREALCFSTWESFRRPLEGGFLRICDRRRRIPVPFDTLDEAYRHHYIENYNAFILGPSGSGKSFFTNWYIRSCYDHGGDILIIDRGDSYETLCAIVREESGGRDGSYCCWSADHPFSFNPFSGWQDWDHEEDNDGKGFLLSVIMTIWQPDGGWDSVTTPVLRQMVDDFLATLDRSVTPVFDDFYSFLGEVIVPRMDPGASHGGARAGAPFIVGHTPVTADTFPIADMDRALAPYGSGGEFGFLLNDPHPADLAGGRFTVFEVEELSRQDPTLYALCTFCILDSFQRKMRRNRDGFKLLFIDEAWAAISNPGTAGYIRNLWKTARKYHTQAVVVTQQISDIVSSPVVQDAVLSNSPVKILPDQRGNIASFAQTVSCLGLSPRDAALVQSVGRNPDPRCRHEVFITLGGRRSAVFSMEVSPEEALAYESDKARKQPLLDLASRRGSIIEAIREMTPHGKKD